MNKYLRLPLNIEVVRYPGQTVLRLSLRQAGLCDWCAALSLLKEGLIETLTVTEQQKTNVKVQFQAQPKPGTTARVTFSSDSSIVAMTKDNLDYVHNFFLKYYRDGVADVDHLDLQAVDTETGNKEIYVTFRVPESKASVSPEEARRRLDGWS